MPYFITDRHPDCDAWALVKEDGELVACHPDSESAQDQMVAVSLAEDLEPGGTYEGESFRALPDELSVGDFVRWESSGGTAQGRIERIERDGTINVPNSDFSVNGEEDDPAALIRIFQEGDEGWGATSTLVAHRFSTLTKIADLESRAALPGDKYTTEQEAIDRAEEIGCSGTHTMDEDGQTIYMPCSTHSEYEELTGSEVSYSSLESRDVDLTPPAYMRAAARRGVELYEQGLAGDGVTDDTVREARAMSNGNVTASKWAAIGPWIARHIVDLEAEQNQPGGEGFPGAGAVAFYLWGATPTARGASRVQDYAENITRMVEEENEGRATGEALSKFETRTFSTDFEVREEPDGMRFSGYAALFNSPSAPLPFTERIAPGAFKRSLKSKNNIFMFYNHDSGQVLASTRAGTMTLSEDGRGLKVDAQLANTNAGRDVAELLRRGDLDSMSFGFSVPSGGDAWNEDGTERTLNSVRLFEVSVVAMPAYPETSGKSQVRGIDKIALRADVDADALADALVKLETGEDISEDDKSLLSKVIDTLSPSAEEEKTEETEDNGKALLELKKKKLALLMKENA